MNIFFPNIGRRCELVELFSKAVVKISPGLIWGSDPNQLAPALNSVDRVIKLPSLVDSSEYLSCLCDFLVRESIDLIIPTIDPDLLRYDSWRGALEKSAPHTRLLIPSSQAILYARDKRLSRDMFSKLGAQVPTSVNYSDSNLNFPLFIKPAAGSASVGAMQVNSMSELNERLLNTIDPMVEEVVSGDEITVDVLISFSGNPLCAIPRRRLQVRGGEVTRAVVERSPQLEELAMKIAVGMNCTGPVTIQFRNPSDKVWVAMEINARMGGGLPLSVAAGADWPRWIIEMSQGIEPQINKEEIIDGLLMTRADISTFLPPASYKVGNSSDMKLPKLVIFDMDDTLYPEMDFVFSGYKAIAKRVWIDYRVDIESELRSLFNRGYRGDLMTAAFMKLGIKIPDSYIKSTLVPAYREHKPAIVPYAEVNDVLQELKKRGHILALLSDGISRVQRNKLEALLLTKYFEEVVFTDELGKSKQKPSIAGFEKILNKFKLKETEAIYIADNPSKDFIGPNRLGMKSARVLRPCTEHFAKLPATSLHAPNFNISSLSDLLK